MRRVATRCGRSVAVPAWADERGAGATLLVVHAALALFFLFALAGDLAKLYVARTQVQHAVEHALFAATQEVDRRELARGRVVIDPTRAQATFLRVLQAEARLDAALRPLPGNRALAGPVELVRFVVYNRTPDRTPEGLPVDRPSVHALVRAPASPVAFRFVAPVVSMPVAQLVGANPARLPGG